LELIFPDGQYRAPKLKAGINGPDRFAAAVAALDAGFTLARLASIPGISINRQSKRVSLPFSVMATDARSDSEQDDQGKRNGIEQFARPDHIICDAGSFASASLAWLALSPSVWKIHLRKLV